MAWHITHNVLLNNLLILFGVDGRVARRMNPYLAFESNAGKSVQENAGYSNRQEINEVLCKSKADLQQAVTTHVKAGERMLDIGCGPGMYLSLFKDSAYELHATDINASMLAEAARQVPQASFYKGDFLSVEIPGRFQFVYCIGVLIYISRGDIGHFIKKIHEHLEPGGVLYLNYPHALSLGDVLYKDITYVQYSPLVIEKLILPHFDILEHHHAFDGRVISRYDSRPYKSLNPDTDRTYKNSYLLIAKKKSL